MAIKPLSVSQINSYIKRILTTDPILGNVTVTGEISNLVHHSSGHCYFALKDETSRIGCFLSADRIGKLRYVFGNGMQVVVSGNLSVYERGGTYSLNIRELDPAGEGALNQAYENLKKKLEAEGLFDAARKRPLPKVPARVAVVTSPTGAAVQDIISTVQRRNPLVDIRIYPCLVQGPDAAASIVEALEAANGHKNDIDLIILGRGGGSQEDLWPFNEEIVARAVSASAVPIISAVGHEVDWVVTDYTADFRAATPTAAAEQAVYDLSPMIRFLEETAPARMYDKLTDQLDGQRETLSRLMEAGNDKIRSVLDRSERSLELMALRYELASPLKILKRGYAIAKNAAGSWVVKTAGLSSGDRLKLLWQDGWANCIIEEVEGGYDPTEDINKI